MGCWDEFCGVSRLPISGGDEVMLIEFGPEETHRYARDTYHFNQAMWRYNQVDQLAIELNQLQMEVEKALTEEQRGEWKRLRPAPTRRHRQPYVFADAGEYDDYGGIEGHERTENAFIMVHKGVWDAIIAFMRPIQEAEQAAALVSKYEWERRRAEEYQPPTDLDLDIALFARYCHTNRIQIHDPERLLGHQHLDRTALDFAHHLAQATAAQWAIQDAKVKEWEAEE